MRQRDAAPDALARAGDDGALSCERQGLLLGHIVYPFQVARSTRCQFSCVILRSAASSKPCCAKRADQLRQARRVVEVAGDTRAVEVGAEARHGRRRCGRPGSDVVDDPVERRVRRPVAVLAQEADAEVERRRGRRSRGSRPVACRSGCAATGRGRGRRSAWRRAARRESAATSQKPCSLRCELGRS